MKKFVKRIALAGGILCAVKGLDDRLETTHYFLRSPKIPKEFDGFCIVQISDVHSDNIPGLVDEIQNEAPDIIVSTGDLAHDKGSYASSVRLCKRLAKIAPVFAVTGNHDVWRSDYAQFERELTAAGVRTLHDERILLAKGGAEIGLAGIDDPFTQDKDRIRKTVGKSLKRLPKYSGYDILLFHRANWVDLLKNQGFDLILSGHMHGGQFRLPIGGQGVISPKSSWSGDKMLFPKYFGGHYKAENTHIIVNRGVGNPMIIPRIFNRPEITVIKLNHKS